MQRPVSPQIEPAVEPQQRDDQQARPYGRRMFFGVVIAGASSVLWGDEALRAVSAALRPVTSRLPDGLSRVLPSPGGGWRIYTVNPPMPEFDERSWRLRVDGLVRRPVELDYATLRGMADAAQVSDFHCVTGWSVPDVRWRGVRFRDLLATVSPLPEASALEFVSAEHPYTDSLTIEQALSGDAMLALDMDDHPLTREHGAPARVVMPRMYGYKNVKWVQGIRVTAGPVEGYWERRGYDRDAWVGSPSGA